jgi:hypothetical protein
MQTQCVADDNAFSRSAALFDSLTGRLAKADALSLSHTDVESILATDGKAIMRQLFQDHLDLRAAQERAAAHEHIDRCADGVLRSHRRDATRQLRTLVGDVVVSRVGYSQRGQGTVFPMDASLNLPPEKFSLGVRHVVALAVASNSYDESIAQLDGVLGVHVPKRQSEVLAQNAACDFDEFYRQRSMQSSTGEGDALLVLTTDAKGVVMRTDDLRPETRRAAQRKIYKLETRLTKGEKKYRKRMATVAAVYSVAPHERSAEEVVADLRHETPSEKRVRPRPHGKRVWASLRRPQDEVIAEMFDEAQRRDPERRKRWVVLVDGNKEQLRLIKQEAAHRGVEVTIVFDFIHVLGYLWAASTAFYTEADPAREGWVLERLRRVLSGKVADVAAGIRRSGTRRDVTGCARDAVDQCADYLLRNQSHMRYANYLRDGLPIGSGVIEGACRHLIKDRMDLCGAHWSLDGAETVLKLRALKTSGDFDAYWEFHRQKEFERNHAVLYAGEPPPPYRTRARPHLRLVP